MPERLKRVSQFMNRDEVDERLEVHAAGAVRVCLKQLHVSAR